MKLGTVCSGIGGGELAFEGLAESAFMSEIEPFPRAVLAHRFPGVPLHGDFTTIKAGQYDAIDVLAGGTPCQSFSIAGLRAGMADERGNLALEYLRLADRLRPRWLLWENVPGILSSNGGRDFGAFLGGLGQLGYGFAYRMLDAQYFGLAQRRKRVFVVGCLGDWRRAAAVLFEPESLRGNPAPRREAPKDVAGTFTSRANSGGWGTDVDLDGGLIARCLTSNNQRIDAETETFVTHTLRGDGFDASEDGTGRGTPIVAQPYTLAVRGRADGYKLEYRQDGTANAILTPNGGRAGVGVGAVAFDCKASGQNGFGIGEINSTLRSMGHSASHQSGGGHAAVQMGATVRRLTPTECERLQGFPDGWTDIQYRSRPAADGPRYKAIGNAWAVPCARWIAKRIFAENEKINSK